MQKWKYMIITYGWDEDQKAVVWSDTKKRAVDADAVQERLDQLGEEGWELVGVDRIQGVAEKTAFIPDPNLPDKWVAEISLTTVRFYLKRPKE